MARTFLPKHPLDGRVATDTGIRAVDHLEIVREIAAATVIAVAGEETSVAAGLASAGNVAVRFVGPGEWLVLSETDTAEDLQRNLAMLLSDTAHVVDQSDGRVVLRLSGPNVRRILAKGIAIDLHPSVFAVGASANVLCGHLSVNLARTDDNAFELIGMSSFAAALFDDLRLMGREFDLSAGFASA